MMTDSGNKEFEKFLDDTAGDLVEEIDAVFAKAEREEREKITRYGMYPFDSAEAVARWNKGEVVWTIEMGGLGPGYEQCIHTLVIELCRVFRKEDLPNFVDPSHPTPDERKVWDSWGDEVITRVDKTLQLSGAQVSAAKLLAYKYIQEGWAAVLNTVSGSRLIQVSNHWPKLSEEIVKAEEEAVKRLKSAMIDILENIKEFATIGTEVPSSAGEVLEKINKQSSAAIAILKGEDYVDAS